MGKYRSFQTNGGRTTLDLPNAIVASIARREAELRKATDSNEVFAKLENSATEDGATVVITAKALNEYRVVGKFSMARLPGCCGVVVSYHAQIETQFRRRGIGGLLLEIREEAAERAGYTMLQATVLVSNSEESTLLQRHGWTVGGEFRNKRTGNAVRFWTKELRES